MSTNFIAGRVEIREKRLKTVLTFQGKASELAEQGSEGKLKIGKFIDIIKFHFIYLFCLIVIIL